jgi:ABC-type amino acid transport substrate-binding protein
MLAALPALLAALALVTGCGDGRSEDDEIRTVEEGTLTVGSALPYPPFAFGRPPSYRGFEVDLVNELGRRLDLKVRFRNTPLDTIFRDLAQKKLDMVSSATVITKQRKRMFHFSDPYFVADQSLMVKRGSGIRTAEDLSDATVGVQAGRTSAGYARNRTRAEVRTYTTIRDAYEALETGRIDAVIADLHVSRLAGRSRPNLKVVQTIELGEEYGFAFAKSADGLREVVSPTLRDMKDDGTYRRIYRKWFRVDPPPEAFGPPGAAGRRTK